MNERLKIIEESIKHDLVHNHGMMVNVTCMDMEWLIDTIKNQQTTIDSLSMAHDNLQRELADIKSMLPKDKHSLIKNLIARNREVSKLRNVIRQDSDKIQGLEEECSGWKEASRFNDAELEKQNKRYRGALEFYADPKVYFPQEDDYCSYITMDYGGKARLALEESE